MIHALKITPEYYEAVKSGKKPFEVRKNDRDFKEGDFLALNEYNPDGAGAGEYSGRAVMAKITYILTNAEYCKEGYVVLGLKPCRVIDGEIESCVMRNLGLPTQDFVEVTNE